MSKHTPGPWGATKDPDGRDYCIGTFAIDDVATCSARDAALIAAAPDMLAALQMTASNLRSWKAANTGIVTMDAWLDEVESAIVKATGSAA